VGSAKSRGPQRIKLRRPRSATARRSIRPTVPRCTAGANYSFARYGRKGVKVPLPSACNALQRGVDAQGGIPLVLVRRRHRQAQAQRPSVTRSRPRSTVALPFFFGGLSAPPQLRRSTRPGSRWLLRLPKPAPALMLSSFRAEVLRGPTISVAPKRHRWQSVYFGADRVYEGPKT
jgi:hypothetical protein